MTENTTAERPLDWDDEISADSAGGDFTLLPTGDYPFTVVGFTRERYEGGAKLPACNKAVIEIKIDGGELGSTTIRENLFLHQRTEGILCAFFTSIGQRQHGDKTRMDWTKVVGSTGHAKVGVREYVKDGEQRSINQVKRWLEPKASSAGGNYTPGSF